MKKSVLVFGFIALLIVAAGVFVGNKDFLLGEKTTLPQTSTQEQVVSPQTVTVAPTTAPVTQAPATSAPASTAPAANVTATQAPTTKVPYSSSAPIYKNPAFKPENITGSYDETAGTYTGYKPLPTVTFRVDDPDNTRGLSTDVIGHSFGVAKDSKPHQISIDSQNYFDKKSFNAVTYDSKSAEKVLYLTFDCGYENGYTFKVLDTLREKNVSAAFFCTLDHIKAEPELIARMIKEGHIVGNHSTKHPNFGKISRTRMAEEIEIVENHLRTNFGYSSPYFRFPEGAYSDSALDLVQSLGYKSVFWSLAYADWDTSAQKGKDYAFKTVTSRLHPGAIILLHSVSADNAEALGEIIDYALSQGYVFKPLTALPK
ncbi:MAG: polysaccharide deacetylase family protein [Clostridia bacterium]|nr:polysaccharide deacetylase family protein [Clostridia bacterium]